MWKEACPNKEVSLCYLPFTVQPSKSWSCCSSHCKIRKSIAQTCFLYWSRTTHWLFFKKYFVNYKYCKRFQFLWIGWLWIKADRHCWLTVLDFVYKQSCLDTESFKCQGQIYTATAWRLSTMICPQIIFKIVLFLLYVHCEWYFTWGIKFSAKLKTQKVLQRLCQCYLNQTHVYSCQRSLHDDKQQELGPHD